MNYKQNRLSSNPKEKEIINFFEKEFSDLDISLMVCGTLDGRTPVKFLDEEEIKIAKGMIQWLGSPVGQGFLRECSFDMRHLTDDYLLKTTEFTPRDLRILASMRGNVDLSRCKRGDILISALGGKLEYIEPLPESDYFDHRVKYLGEDLGEGTRANDGYVFRKNRKPETDHDIVRIIKLR